MPAVALVGAAGSVMAGLAAVEAGSLLVGGLMIAGGVTSGIGTLTGDKTLSRMGTVLGLAGGVAGLASGTWSSTAADIAKDSSDISTIASDATGVTNAVAPEGGNGIINAAANPSLNPAQTQMGGGNWVSPSDPTAYQPLQGAAAPSSPLTAPPGNANMPAAPSLNQAPAGTPAATASTPTYGNLGAPTPAPTATPGGIAPPPAAQGLFEKYFKPIGESIGKAGEFIKNKDNAELLKVGGGLVSAGMKAYSDQALLDQQYQRQLAYRRQMQENYTNSMRGVTLPAAKG